MEHDGETNIVDIAGASVEVFRPGVDIVSGEPYFSLGTEITTPPLTVQHQTSVNGQVLRPADTQSLEGTNYLHFAYPNEILRATANNTDLTTKFVSNDRVEITNASFTFNGQTYDLNGTYSVLSVADDRMTLSNPAAVNANWLKLKELNNQQTAALSPKISSIGENGLVHSFWTMLNVAGCCVILWPQMDFIPFLQVGIRPLLTSRLKLK